MERYIITIDVGTTAIKGVLLTTDLDVVGEHTVELTTYNRNGHVEQDPRQWYTATQGICKEFLSAGIQPQAIEALCFSGQMQDVICIDDALQPVANAILYSDFRASAEAEEILDDHPQLSMLTGNQLDGSIPLAKLFWLRRHAPQILVATRTILFSAKDYVVARLCGNLCTDVTTAATTSLMDIDTKTWIGSLLTEYDIPVSLLPDLHYAHDLAGTLTAQAAGETGLALGTKVFVGTGDAGATTLASGICRPGELNINLGTTGWVAAISDSVHPSPGVFNLAAMPVGRYINVVPFLNAGNVHRWICSILGRDDDGYDYVENLLGKIPQPAPEGLFCLPYLSGERFPVADSTVRGSITGITNTTAAADLAQAALEGVAFALRQGLELFGLVPTTISLIGGGARSVAWCRIFANVLGREIRVFDESEYLPAMATASAALFTKETGPDYESFLMQLKQKIGYTTYGPTAELATIYDKRYEAFKRLYPLLKQVYQENESVNE